MILAYKYLVSMNVYEEVKGEMKLYSATTFNLFVVPHQDVYCIIRLWFKKYYGDVYLHRALTFTVTNILKMDERPGLVFKDQCFLQ